MAHALDDREQVDPLLRERVLDARRDLGVGVALDDAVLLERAQPQRERPRADPRERALELAEAAAPRGEVADEQQRPLAADQLRGVDDGAVVIEGHGHSILYQLKQRSWRGRRGGVLRDRRTSRERERKLTSVGGAARREDRPARPQAAAPRACRSASSARRPSWCRAAPAI